MTKPEAYHLTKIIATLGPASDSREMVAELVKAGADLFRLNFSHGTHERHAQVIKHIRKLEERIDKPIGIIADLQGPKLRVGDLPEAGVPLIAGKQFVLKLEGAKENEHECNLPHPEIFLAAEVGTDLLLDDGNLRLRIKTVTKDKLVTEVIVGGLLKPHKGVNYPGKELPIDPLTDKDKKDLEFALEQSADWIAMSFVQRKEDLQAAQKIIAGRSRLIAKIEKPLAVSNFDSLIEHCDAIMVARGDLGVETPPEMLPALQKRLIKKCRAASRPVIVATQMLESMIHAAAPTRAEASDVATALYDGTDAVMLFGRKCFRQVSS